MTSRISQVTLDVRDVQQAARFWSAVLGGTVELGDDGCATLRPPGGGEPTMWLQAGAGAKSQKLRCHIDLRTDDLEAELDRLLALGARRADVGQRGDEGFEVLSDPEGNEFCLLHEPQPPVPAAEARREEQVARIGELLHQRGHSLAIAESLTGGLLVQAVAKAEGSGEWLRGAVVAYASDVKHELLGVEVDKVVSAPSARQMASGVRRALSADVAVAVTGVGGPDRQDGEPPGTVWIGLDGGAGPVAHLLAASGSPEDICHQTVDAALGHLLALLSS
jgi:nicotinamide-nucleotide amidase